jgi:hypothetical protein
MNEQAQATIPAAAPTPSSWLDLTRTALCGDGVSGGAPPTAQVRWLQPHPRSVPVRRSSRRPVRGRAIPPAGAPSSPSSAQTRTGIKLGVGTNFSSSDLPRPPFQTHIEHLWIPCAVSLAYQVFIDDWARREEHAVHQCVFFLCSDSTHVIS